jgi:hypothetical protein
MTHLMTSCLKAAGTITLALAAIFGTAGISNATTLPVLHAGSYQVAHTCAIIGSANGYKAVVCADLDTAPYNNGSGTKWSYYGAVEALCETTSGVVVRCPKIYEYGTTGNGAGGRENTQSGCGAAFGTTCPLGRLYSYTNTVYGDNGCNTSNANYYNQAWTVALSGTTIVIPSGQQFTMQANSVNTGHYYVCVL